FNISPLSLTIWNRVIYGLYLYQYLKHYTCLFKENQPLNHMIYLPFLLESIIFFLSTSKNSSFDLVCLIVLINLSVKSLRLVNKFLNCHKISSSFSSNNKSSRRVLERLMSIAG